jgi:hypothetical protein
MKRFMQLAAVVAVCASALFAAGGASARPQIIIVNSYSGHYEGFFNSAAFGQVATFTMQIAPSRTSVYSGLLISGAVQEPFRVAIGPDGGFLAGGTGQSGFLALGRAQAIAGGASSLSTAAYVLRTPLGSDHGSLRFIQSFASGDATQLPASLTGTCTDAAGVASPVAFQTSAGATVPGDPDFSGDVTAGGVDAPLVGSIGNPDLRTGLAPLVATAVSTGGSIDFDGSWVSGGQPHMQGTLTVTLAGGAAQTETDCALVPAVQTAGR